MNHLPLLSLALLSLPAAAQDLAEGNGYGDAYIQVGPAYLGGFFKHDIGSPSAPNSFAVFSYSDGFQTTVHPILGPVALNIFSPVYGIIILPTGPTGNLHFELYLPAIPEWVGLPPFYSNVVTFEGGQWSSSKTVPLWFENANSWTPVADMGTPRMYHTATELGQDGKDNRIKVLIAGGGAGTVTVPTATNTTEIFDPLSRTFTPGPTMAVERATHTATLLPDGRVLVTGGFADYQSPASAWDAALNSAQNTAELYDPASGAWTPVAQTMSSKRAAHTATKLADGKVMLVCGVNGGGLGSIFGAAIVPFFTSTVDLFDPATDTFSPLPDLALPFATAGGRAFHGASLLGDGRVLVTGGVWRGGTNGEAISTKDCQVFDGTAWSLLAPLPVAVGWHNQVTLADGNALVSGGLEAVGVPTLNPKAFTGEHVGTTVSALGAIGLNPGIPGSAPDTRGAMSVTRLHDGSLLFLGGTLGTTSESLATGYVYTPKP